MDYSMPGFPVLQHLLELAQTHVHWVSDAIQPSHPGTLFPSWLQSFPASGSFLMSQFFTSNGQSIGASASDAEACYVMYPFIRLLVGSVSLHENKLHEVGSSLSLLFADPSMALSRYSVNSCWMNEWALKSGEGWDVDINNYWRLLIIFFHLLTGFAI